jgi:hypothetical protein
MKIRVSNDLDSSVRGSLRGAVERANQESESVNIIISSKVKEIHLVSELVITSNVQIIGNGTTLTTSNARHFHISNCSRVILKNLHLTGGNESVGGAVYNETPESNLILQNVRISGNMAVLGGGVFTWGNLLLIDCSIDCNTALKQGGGIWCGQNLTMYKSTADSNKVLEVSTENFGGGVAVDSGNAIVSNSSISYNIVECVNTGGSAGAINIMNGSLLAQNSHFDENEAFSSGGVQVGVGDVTLLKSSISKNKSFIAGTNCGGGGIVITCGNVSVQDSEICDNETQGMYSGGIVSFLGNVTVLRSKISGNSNCGPGGAIAANFNSTITVSQSKISSNTASSLGGAIVNFSDETGQILVYNSEITSNTLTNQQLIGQTIEAFLSVVTAHVTQSTGMTQYYPTPGGHKLVSELPTLLNLAQQTQDLLRQIDIDENSTGGGAIATLLKCPVTVTKSKLSKNLVTKKVNQENTPFFATGGALLSALSLATIEDCQIDFNTSSNEGSAISSSGILVLENSKLSKNEGNGVLVNEGVATIIKTSLSREEILNKGSLTIIN